MQLIFLFLFIYVPFVYSLSYRSDDEVDLQEIRRMKIIEKLTKTHTELHDGYQMLLRMSTIPLFTFRSYRNVQIIVYEVPEDVSEAKFTFISEDVQYNSIGSCTVETNSIHLKYGSLAAVNPNGYAFPRNFIDPKSRDIPMHDLVIYSNGTTHVLNIENPKPGYWYAIVYTDWVDPDSERVTQEGLTAACQTYLYTDLQVKRAINTIVNCYEDLIFNVTNTTSLYKCKIEDDHDRVNIKVQINNENENISKAAVKIQAISPPGNDNYIFYCYIDLDNNYDIVLSFLPNPNAWHYISVENFTGNASAFAQCESYTDPVEEDVNHTTLSLLKEFTGQFFAYHFSLPSTDIKDSISVLNLTANEITIVKFNIFDIQDIGGTLEISTSMLLGIKYYMGFKRNFYENTTLMAFSDNDQYIKIVVCLNMDHHSVPLPDGRCKFNDKIKPALLTINSTDAYSIDEQVFIPYPDAGTWYLSVRLFCDNIVCPCRTINNGSKYLVETDFKKMADYRTTSGLSNESREGVNACNGSVMLSIASRPCVNYRCSGRGSCGFTNSMGGVLFSSCTCYSGYGGWDCSDSSRSHGHGYLLLSVLLLTLSNLLFFFSIYVAIIRLYYAEAVMYTFTMVMSTFYHACDAPEIISYCIIRGSLLQYADFYCGIMSFWVTLLSMSVISKNLHSVLQLSGSIVVAILTTWNMYSLATFLAPCLFGVFIVLSTWSYDFSKTRKFKFPKSYYVKYLPIGMIFVFIGLICYAGLQTEANYKFVHSLWHMIIAISVALLLPDVKRGSNVKAFLPSSSQLNNIICKGRESL